MTADNRPRRQPPPPALPGRAIRRPGWPLGILAALAGFVFFFQLGRQTGSELGICLVGVALLLDEPLSDYR